MAAALGLGGVVAVVLLLWTVSPHPDDGPGAALRVAADLWLLAHGVALVRVETLGGTPAPIGITPLLLTMVPGWLLVRAVRVCVVPRAPEGGGPGEVAAADDGVRAALWICAGYLTVTAAAALYLSDGPIRAEPWSALLCPPLFALVVTVTTSWWLCGPVFLREHTQRLVETGAPRAALAGLAAVGGAGAVLAAAALAVHANAAQTAFGQIAGDWSGRLALLLLACALAPNAAVWAAAYGLGPGFVLGGVTMSPLVAGAAETTGPAGEVPPWLPAFPLLAAATPGGGQPADGPQLALAALVPVAGAAVIGLFLARTAVPVRADRETATGWRETVLAAALTAGLIGAALISLAWLAGGPVGTGELARLGPDPWLTGAAAAGWTVVLATPAALGLRAWRLRGAPRERRLSAGPGLGSRAPGAHTFGAHTSGTAGSRATRARGRLAAGPHTTGDAAAAQGERPGRLARWWWGSRLCRMVPGAGRRAESVRQGPSAPERRGTVAGGPPPGAGAERGPTRWARLRARIAPRRAGNGTAGKGTAGSGTAETGGRGPGEWSGEARSSRWARLKDASGGLVPGLDGRVTKGATPPGGTEGDAPRPTADAPVEGGTADGAETTAPPRPRHDGLRLPGAEADRPVVAPPE